MLLYDLQTWISLGCSILAVSCHLYHPWGSMEALYGSSLITAGYNVVDLGLGGARYWSSDHSTLLHHAVVLGVSLGVLCWTPAHPSDIEELARWSYIGEITTIFNSLRILLRRTAWGRAASWVFAAVFLPLRAAMSLGLYGALCGNAYAAPVAPCAYAMTCLNLHWGRRILRKALGAAGAPPAWAAAAGPSGSLTPYLLLAVPPGLAALGYRVSITVERCGP